MRSEFNMLELNMRTQRVQHAHAEWLKPASMRSQSLQRLHADQRAHTERMKHHLLLLACCLLADPYWPKV